MLGIMIGVAAVITLLSIGDGVNRYVADQFVGLGTNLVFIVPNDDPNRTESSLTLDDANSTAILINGLIGSGVSQVDVDRKTLNNENGSTATRVRLPPVVLPEQMR